MNQLQLNTILDKHKKWLDGEEGGERANLQGAYIREYTQGRAAVSTFA